MWELAIQLDPDRREPLFLQIAHTIVEATRRGRLRPGDPLPSTRALAVQLGLHRKTVTAAYRELASQGWISIVRARGARISRDLPEVPRARGAGELAARAGFELPGPVITHSPPVARRRGQLLLLGGVPDLASAPRLELGRAYRATIARRTAIRLLDFEPPHGGMALWARAPGIDVDAWVARAADAGVAFQPGSRFTFDGRRNDFVRLGFGACTERELAEAARRMAATLPRRRR